MISKIGDRKITITPRALKENEKHCEKCGGTGWLYIEREEEKYIEKCPICDNGIIHICPECGNVTGKWTCCNDKMCRLKREEIYELARYEKATKYTLDNVPKESMEYFFSDLYGDNNGFFDDIDSLEDYCRDNDIELPKYIWGTNKKELSIDAYNFITNELEEWYEDAFEGVNDNELAKLQVALDDFCKNCGVGACYDVDYKTCVNISDISK